MGLRTGYRFRIFLFAALMLVLVVVSFVFTIGIAWYSKSMASWMVGKDFRAQRLERQLSDLLLSLDLNLKHFLILQKPEYQQRVSQTRGQLRAALRELDDLGLSDRERRMLRDLWHDLGEVPAVLPQDGKRGETGLKPLSDAPLQRVRELLTLSQERIDRRIEGMRDLQDKTIRLGICWAMVSLVAACLLAVFLVRSIARPIGAIRKGTQEIAEGRFLHRVQLRKQDELGDLAEAFNEMALQLKKLDDMKSEFMATVSHELKTPLTSMKGAVELLLEEAVGPINPKQRHLLDISSEGIQRLTGFVDEILSLTRMEEGLIDLDRTWFDFLPLVQGKLETFRLVADKRGVRLSSVFRPQRLPSIYGDAGRLRQVLANLLSNAIHFTPAGGEVCLRVDYHGHPDRSSSRRRLEVRVIDSGKGIPAGEWERIFDKFYQVRSGGQRGTGSGLGLAIARHIIEAHGGSIWVEDSSERGTTLCCVLPQEFEQGPHERQKDPTAGDRLAGAVGAGSRTGAEEAA